MTASEQRRARTDARRWAVLRELDALTERPLIVLSLVWLALLVIELTWGLSRPLELLTYAIWGLFIADFVIELVIAPDRLAYLRSHWLTAVSLVLPAARLLRVTRLFRLASSGRAVRSLSLLRVLTTINRGIRALGRTLVRRGLGYVVAITVVVAIAGAAGMLAFESPAALEEAGVPAVEAARGFSDYADALWWTAMILVTLGSGYWPTTGEGRILTFLLALYGFAVFGYITASIASHFLGQAGDRDAATRRDLAEEVRRLRVELARTRPEERPNDDPRDPAPDG